MEVVYAREVFPSQTKKTLFLAGPTPRSERTPSWRPEALAILAEIGFDGTVFVPEALSGEYAAHYDDQIEWELAALNRADAIVFWVPRDSVNMPAFTTNVEFGMWISSGRVSFGSPDGAERMGYLKHLAKKEHVAHHSTLEGTLRDALAKIGEGALRVGGEAEVPLSVWKTGSFQNWLGAQKKAGNRLDGAEVKWTFRVGPDKSFVFLWVVHANVFVAVENRNKSNEIVISRTDTSSVVLFKREADVLDSKIVIAKEFRSTASTADAFIWEVPGGSSFKPSENALEVAASEVFEEIGLKLAPERFRFIQKRQSSGTVLANQTAMFTAEITDSELDWIVSQKEIVKGNIAESEMIHTEVLTFREVLGSELADWTNVGMIARALLDNLL